MYPLKQSTAITIAFFVHDANGDAVTGLTDGSFTKRISKGSGAFSAMTATITEMENGMYSFPLSASHSDTPGILTVILTNAGAKQVNLQYRVFAALFDETYDATRDVGVLVEHRRGHHTHQPIGNVFYVSPNDGATWASGARGGIDDPLLTIQDCVDNAVTDSNHDTIILLADGTAGPTTHTVAATTTIDKRYTFLRGPGRDMIITRTGAGDTLAVTAEGVEISGMQIGTAAVGSGNGISITADFCHVHDVWVNNTQGDGININQSANCLIHDCTFQDTGAGGSGDGIEINGTGSSSNNNEVRDNTFADVAGDGIRVTGGTIANTIIRNNIIHGATGDGIDINDGTDTTIDSNVINNSGAYGILIGAGSTNAHLTRNVITGSTTDDIQDNGTTTTNVNNTPWADEFHGEVSIDTANGTSGIVPPTGTRGQPVDNIADALTIATREGIDRFELRGSITLAAGFTNKVLVGVDENATVALGGQDVSGTTFENVSISGTAAALTAQMALKGCYINSSNLVGFQGLMSNCRIEGNVTFAAGASSLVWCSSIDDSIAFGAGAALVDIAIRSWRGDVQIVTSTNAGSAWVIDMDSGTIDVLSGFSAGSLTVRGIGDLTGTLGMDTLDQSGLMAVADYQVLVKLGTIYIDSEAGAGGTGTYADPADTAAAARTLADALGIRRYHVRGAIQLSQDHTDWTFAGTSASSVVLNGWSVDRSVFEGIAIYGTAKIDSRGQEIQGSRITAIDCTIDNANNLHGLFQLCGFPSRFQADLSIYGSDYVFDRCRSLVPAGDTNVYGTIDIYESDFGSNTEIMAAWDNVAIGQSFTGNGENLGVARFFASAYSDDPGVITVTGTLTAKLYAHTGTFGAGGTPTGAALATSTTTINADDAAVYPAFEWLEFEFDNTFTLVDGTNYFIVLEHAGHDNDFDQWVEVRTDSNKKLHAGNMAKNSGSWSASANDLPFWIGTRVGVNGYPVFDLGDVDVPHNLQMHSWGGSIEIANMSAGDIDLGMLGGDVNLASTVTGGTIHCHGSGHLTDNSAGAAVTNNLNSSAAVMTTDMTEEYPGDGVSAVSPAAMLYSINQMLSEFARTGTTVSVKKRDGTEAFQIELDDGTAPTSATQST